MERQYMFSITIFILTLLLNIKCEHTFGKFSLNVTSIDRCKGPKRKDCATWTAKIDDGKIIHFNVTVYEDIAPLKGKIMVSSNGKSLVRLQMNKVCEHIFLKPVLKTVFNMTDNCIMLKGDYFFHIDTEELIQRYYGGDFFFGKVSFKSVFNNDDCNFTCSNLKVILYPKQT